MCGCHVTSQEAEVILNPVGMQGCRLAEEDQIRTPGKSMSACACLHGVYIKGNGNGTPDSEIVK